MFFKRVTLFRFFGFDVRADASWIFLSIFISWTFATQLYPGLLPRLSPDTYQFMGVFTLAGLLFSILAHEVAHAVIAEYYHMPIRSITLFIFGGVAEMKGEPSHPRGEFYMAIAGPIMSLLLGLFFWAAAHLSMVIGYAPLTVSLDYLGDINMSIAVFNMFPAFPLDGGRALRALLWQRHGNLVKATRTASKLGSAFAYALMAYASQRLLQYDDVVGGVWITILGLFVFAACQQAVRDTESRSLLAQEQVRRFMHDQFQTVTPHLTIAELVERYAYAHYQSDYPVIEDGRLTGVLTLQSILQLPREKWPWLHVATVMEPLSHHNSVPPDASAADALDILVRRRRSLLLVCEDERWLGAVEYRDLAAYLNVTRQIDQNKAVEKSR